MSAALTLPYVWATANPFPPQKTLRSRPLSGMAFYRKHTETLLRRYLAASMAVGRAPSVLGNVMFRGRATSCYLRNFEDAVIFVIDVENCLKRLDKFSQEVVARIALQEYTQAETAELMGQSPRSIVRIYAEVLDRLTSILLEAKLLDPDAAQTCHEDD